MSGDNWLNPSQDLQWWKQIISHIDSTTKWEPIRVSKYEEKTYFNNVRATETRLQYDLHFMYSRPGPLYDQRKRIENEKFLTDIRENIYQQESKKIVPVLTSLTYGRRVSYDRPEYQFNRVEQIPSFYRRNGVLPAIEKPVSSNIHELPKL